MDRLEGCVDRLEGCVDRLEGCVDRLEGCVDRLEGCVDRLEGCVDRLEGCVDRLEGCVDRLEGCVDRLEGCVDRLEGCVDRLEGCVDRHAPLNPKETKFRNKPWISNELIKMINVRNKLFQRKKCQPNNTNVTNLYKLFRNRINREIKKSKREFFNQYFENNSNNIKKTWDGIRSIVNTKDSTIANITQLKVMETLIDNPKRIAEEVNGYVVNVGPKTEKVSQ